MKSEIEEKFHQLIKKSPKSKEEIEEVQILGKLWAKELSEEINNLIYELSKTGVVIHSIWDLVNTKKKYPEAIEVLIKHLSKHYHDKNKEGIIRALTVKEAKGKANSALIAEYDKIPKEKHNLRWIIGNAFTVIITKEDVESISKIVKDKSNGMSRYRFVEALGKIKSEEAKACLKSLLNDEQMQPYALKALKK